VRAAFDQLLRWCAHGRIRPHASDVLPLRQAREALELLLTRKSTGKVVLRMGA
jgi:NADPH2:quinone reductase